MRQSGLGRFGFGNASKSKDKAEPAKVTEEVKKPASRSTTPIKKPATRVAANKASESKPEKNAAPTTR